MSRATPAALIVCCTAAAFGILAWLLTLRRHAGRLRLACPPRLMCGSSSRTLDGRSALRLGLSTTLLFSGIYTFGPLLNRTDANFATCCERCCPSRLARLMRMAWAACVAEGTHTLSDMGSTSRSVWTLGTGPQGQWSWAIIACMLLIMDGAVCNGASPSRRAPQLGEH